MKTYLYLSLIPESLVASMLPPEEFGNYYAVGSKKRTRGQAIFFELDPSFKSDYFNMAEIEKRCVPGPEGQPKRSVYLSVYRALEHVPLEAFRKLYLVTDDGRVLGIDPKPFQPENDEALHLYQEFCPVTVRVASRLSAPEFSKFITDPNRMVSVPKIVFAEMILRNLRQDPEHGDVEELPYKNIGHLRDCLKELEGDDPKKTKTVNRQMSDEVLYRTIRNGFFVGSQEKMLYYPMPSPDQLEREYYEWWRSAQATFGH